ncbi:hypothetical protein Tco_0951519 [Tanacetum coccineum]|uniref:Uncharacterized protein n=1 Tax=Tanacetum coccineum TaxID=301880 RepID=A0ABQ5E145_9ASTR
MILNSLQNGPFVWPTVEESSTTRTKKYEEVSVVEKHQANYDLKATNIVLQGLPPDVLPLEWSKFMMDVKLARDLHTINYDQLYSYLEQHERHANETRLMRERYQNPLAFLLQDSLQPTINLELPLIEETKPLFKMEGLLYNKFKGGKDKVMLIEDLDAYDSDCHDVLNAKVVLMANLSNYGYDVIIEAAVQDTNVHAQQDSMILSLIEQMSEQMITHVNNCEKANQEKNNKSLTVELKRYKE